MKKIICFLLSITALSSCIDRGKDCVNHYVFEVDIEISPFSNSYNIGDTLNFLIHTDNENLVDLVDTGRMVNFPLFDPKAWFIMPSLDSVPFIDGFIVNQVLLDTIFGVTQKSLPGGRTSGIFFQKIDTSTTATRIEVDIVLNKKGTYAFYAETSLSSYDENNFIEFPDRCGGRCCSTLDADYKIEMDNIDILTDLHKANEDIFWKDFSGQRALSTPFYFKVE